MIQSDHPVGKRMRRRRGGANRLINCRHDPPAKVLAARISMSHLVPLLEFNRIRRERSNRQRGVRRFGLSEAVTGGTASSSYARRRSRVIAVRGGGYAFVERSTLPKFRASLP